MKVKRYLMMASLWLVLLSAVVISKPAPMTYEIRLDEDTRNSAEIKQEVLSRYAELIRGVHEESQAVLLVHNLDQFMWESDMQAEWIDQTLRITIGEGNGAIISGDLDPQEMCLPEVKPKSLLQEWLKGE